MSTSNYKSRLLNPFYLGIYKDSREDYLTYVVYLNVATEEEQKEFNEIFRAKVLAAWNKHIKDCDKQREEHQSHIELQKKEIIKLRQLGRLDMANKREEFVLLLEKKEFPGYTTWSYRSFDLGWD